MKDGSYYTSLVSNKASGSQAILKYSTITGKVTDTLIHGQHSYLKEINIPYHLALTNLMMRKVKY